MPHHSRGKLGAPGSRRESFGRQTCATNRKLICDTALDLELHGRPKRALPGADEDSASLWRFHLFPSEQEEITGVTIPDTLIDGIGNRVPGIGEEKASRSTAIQQQL